MTSQVYFINDYKFSSTDAVLFDANAWLYIYGPQGERSRANKNTYTLAMSRIRRVKGQIFVDGFVMSEFINAYSRYFYNQLPADTKPVNFKTFRDSDNFRSIAVKIARHSRLVLKKCERIETGFTSVDWEHVTFVTSQGINSLAT